MRRDTVHDLVLVAIGVICFVLVVLLSLGCGSPPAPVKRPDYVVERRACLPGPPPSPPRGVLFEACMDPTFVACLSKESSVALFLYLSRLKRYAVDAYDHCGPAAKETP